VPQILFYEAFALFSALTLDPRQHKTFLHPQTTQGAHAQQKQTAFVRYQNPPSSLHSRKNICAGSKVELGSSNTTVMKNT